MNHRGGVGGGTLFVPANVQKIKTMEQQRLFLWENIVDRCKRDYWG